MIIMTSNNSVLRAIPTQPSTPAHTRRRGWTPAQKLAYLAAYETACETGEGAAYLRREGIYKSAVYEWRKQRDAGILDGTQPSTKPGRLSKEQTEIARLTQQVRRLEGKLATTETALDIMGKAHALLEQISESADTEPTRNLRS